MYIHNVLIAPILFSRTWSIRREFWPTISRTQRTTGSVRPLHLCGPLEEGGFTASVSTETELQEWPGKSTAPPSLRSCRGPTKSSLNTFSRTSLNCELNIHHFFFCLFVNMLFKLQLLPAASGWQPRAPNSQEST